MSSLPSLLTRNMPDAWASEWGEDRYGVYQSFAVGPVIQRMRWIRPGTFVMGSPPGEVGRFNDEVAHEVTLTEGYWLADTPCTQALWLAVMGSNPSNWKDPQRPVEQVSWKDCQPFLSRLNKLVPGLAAGGQEARLPTEAEWEHACRANTQMATWVGGLGRGGEERSRVLDDIAWYHGNSGGETHTVAQKAQNPWGLYDMLGNVWEWCEDWYGEYEAGAATNPCGPQGGSSRVNRGGSWLVLARTCRAALRRGVPPGSRYSNLGFRLARGQAHRSGGAERRGGAESGRRAEPPATGA